VSFRVLSGLDVWAAQRGDKTTVRRDTRKRIRPIRPS
jgi:hypothetical protein